MTARTCGALINSNSRAVIDVSAPCCSAIRAADSTSLLPLLLQPGLGKKNREGRRGGKRRKEGKSRRGERLQGEMGGWMDGCYNLGISICKAWSAPKTGFNSGFQHRFRFSTQESLCRSQKCFIAPRTCMALFLLALLEVLPGCSQIVRARLPSPLRPSACTAG